MLLHLRDLLDLQSSPTVLPFSLSHHVETMSSPPKYTDWRYYPGVQLAVLQYTSVEMSGIEPESTAPSLQRDYNNSFKNNQNRTAKNTVTTTTTPIAKL